jgi:hypothetical protein
MMTHSEYTEYLGRCLSEHAGDGEFEKSLEDYRRELIIMANLNLDPVIPLLGELYSPSKRRTPKDPVCMLRSLILMTLRRESSVTKWVKETRSSSVPAVICGFDPGETPGVGTYYGFFDRIADGPYHKPCGHTVRQSEFLSGPHLRNLKDEKAAAKEDAGHYHSKSEKLAAELLSDAGEPRKRDFRQILEDLLLLAGVIPSVEAGLIKDLEKLAVSGDGSVLETAASSSGKPVCSCRSEGIFKCGHPRSYTSPTAQWCYDQAHDVFKFGDRYYHLAVTQKGHDFPLLIVMPGGNESDYTLSLTAFDRFLKAAEENGTAIRPEYFIGDGHHDSYAHYHYFSEKEVIPVIPLSENSRNAYLRLSEDKKIRYDTDGTPLCPGGACMRRHGFDKNKQTHIFSCPAKRGTHRNGKFVYVMHTAECPLQKDCAPGSPAGPFVRVKSADDPRLFPPLPRNTKKFGELSDQRSASERLNAVYDNYKVEKSSRNAVRGLIRLNLAAIAHHAVIRFSESLKGTSEAELFARTAAGLRAGFGTADRN